MFTAQHIFKWYRHSETLFRRRVLRCLPIFPSKMTLGLYGLNITPIHVPASVFLGQRQTVQTHSQIRHRIVLFSVISIFTVCLQNARTRYYQLSKSYSQTKNNNTSTPPLPPKNTKKNTKKTQKKRNVLHVSSSLLLLSTPFQSMNPPQKLFCTHSRSFYNGFEYAVGEFG